MTFDKMFLDVAAVVAQKSKSTRLKVGAVLVRDNRILSTGYNGLVSGTVPDVLEDENGVTKKEVIHAELNCIISCARNGVSCDNSILYLTHSPCQACAALVAQAGIKKVIYMEDYRELDGVLGLRKRGVDVVKYGYEQNEKPVYEKILRDYDIYPSQVFSNTDDDVSEYQLRVDGEMAEIYVKTDKVPTYNGWSLIAYKTATDENFRKVVADMGYIVGNETTSISISQKFDCIRSTGSGDDKKFTQEYANNVQKHFGWDVVYDDNNPIGNKLADGNINYWK